MCTDIHHLGGVADPAPRHVGDVEQTVESAEVDERPEVRDVLDNAFPHLAGKKLLDQCGALLLALALENDAPRHDDVPPALVQLDDLEIVGVADQVLDVRDPAKRDLGTGEEGVDAHYVDRYTSLDLARQESLHRLVVLERVLDQLPDPEEVRFLLGQHDDAVFVLEALEKHLDILSRLDGVGVLELFERYGPLTLEAEFEDDGRLGRSEDPGLHDLTLADIAAGGLVLGEHRLEVVARDVEDLFAIWIVEQLG